MPEKDGVSLPMERGDVLLMHKEIPHRSRGNFSDGIRWSMDLRYQLEPLLDDLCSPIFRQRSAAHPESVLSDHAEWCRRWIEAFSFTSGAKFASLGARRVGNGRRALRHSLI